MKTSPRDYYERHQFLYNWLWSRTALRYGLWLKGITTRSEAIDRTNVEVANSAGIQPDDRVLDLGSGTGGTAVALASMRGCTVNGITISPRQQVQAQRHAKTMGVADKDMFKVADFDQPLPFPDGSFTVITAVESFCHAHDKQAVMRELFRVLAPSGRIVFIDGFLVKDSLTPSEQKRYDVCRKGWQVSSLFTVAAHVDAMLAAGFVNPTWDEYTRAILPSSNRIRRIGLFMFAPSWLLTTLHISPLLANARCMIAQRGMFNGIAQYGIVTARKAG